VTGGKAVSALFLLFTTAVLAAGCSSPSPSATKKVGQTTTTTAAVATCPASSISASVDFTKFGGTSSSVAGALLFRNTGSTPCSLRGVPLVQVVSTDGQAISSFEAPGFVLHPSTAVLPAGGGSGSSAAGASFTISSWACAVGSFSLLVRFTGWATFVPAISGAASGACVATQEVDETLYVSPVAALRS
jgi:Protein of unknown function (DUF4232)